MTGAILHDSSMLDVISSQRAAPQLESACMPQSLYNLGRECALLGLISGCIRHRSQHQSSPGHVWSLLPEKLPRSGNSALRSYTHYRSTIRTSVPAPPNAAQVNDKRLRSPRADCDEALSELAQGCTRLTNVDLTRSRAISPGHVVMRLPVVRY
eukprot:3171756-Rhodomonas_salina.3